jgi:hypothetical protein
MKTCYSCRQSKGYAEFHRNSSAPDGLAYYCRTCLKEKAQQRKEESLRRKVEDKKKNITLSTTEKHMKNIEFNEGDTLTFTWKSTTNTPFGPQKVTTKIGYTYEEILEKLKTPEPVQTAHKRSGGARFSYMIAHAVKALKEGKWSSGPKVKKEAVLAKLLENLSLLDKSEYTNVTRNARRTLSQVLEDDTILNLAQRTTVKHVLDTISV